MRTEVREATEKEFQEQLESSRKTYDGLTQKLAHASDNVGEFFEPLSRLAVHVGTELVRGELTVGSNCGGSIVQGCLDQLEGYQPKNPPILRMHLKIWRSICRQLMVRPRVCSYGLTRVWLGAMSHFKWTIQQLKI